ncbi:hypothetical protein [Xanthomonas campestris]|uniref:hypothetical protein n=1 Tax=Xanthomonas TaxID=338 RepID=UPI001E512509|nr:hypothetical protein [Xanthomonas campestris]MCC5088753.1 hypothetical protein [Xanthomonas campestris]
MKSKSNSGGDELEKFQEFIFGMDDALEGLIAAAAAEGISLDYSLDSINSLEILIDIFYGKPGATRNLTRCSSYLGEMFRREIGGHWDLCQDDPRNIYYKLPVITNFSAIRADFCPIAIIENYITRRRRGLLRGALEVNREFSNKNKDKN